MKRFKFSLEKVLDYNTHIQKREKDALAALNFELAELEEQKKLLIEKYNTQKQNYISGCSTGIAAVNIVMILCYIRELQNQLAFQERKITDKKSQIERQKERLLAVTKEKMKVEKLKESKLKLYKEAERKSDEKFIDEFVSNKLSNMKS